MDFGSGRISFYDERGNYLGYGIYENSDVRPAFLTGSVFRENAVKLDVLDGKTLIILPHQDYWNTAIGNKLISVLWKIIDLDTGKKSGYVEVQQAFTEITKLLPTDDACDTGNGVFYSRRPERDSDEIVAWNVLKNNAWTLAYTQDTHMLFKPARVISRLVFLAGLFVLLLGIGVVFLISGRLGTFQSRRRSKENFGTLKLKTTACPSRFQSSPSLTAKPTRSWRIRPLPSAL